MIGQSIKVLLPGERPWVQVIEEADDKFKGKIINTLFRELSEHEQARFMKRETGEVQQLPELHSFKKGDEVWFEQGIDECAGWWVPAQNGKISMADNDSNHSFPDGFVSEILTLLDRIEIEDDSSLASQRFAIGEKHGLTVEFGEPVSGMLN